MDEDGEKKKQKSLQTLFSTSLKPVDPIKVPSSEPSQSMTELEEVKHKEISRPQVLCACSSERFLISSVHTPMFTLDYFLINVHARDGYNPAKVLKSG